MPISNPSTAKATKEFFIPTNDVDQTLGSHRVKRLAVAGHKAYVAFAIPGDFSSLLEAVIIGAWDASHAGTDLDIIVNYAGAGEAYNVHAETDTVTTYDFTADEVTEIDISSLLSALAPGDHVGVSLELNTDPGDNLSILGVRVKYA